MLRLFLWSLSGANVQLFVEPLILLLHIGHTQHSTLDDLLAVHWIVTHASTNRDHILVLSNGFQVLHALWETLIKLNLYVKLKLTVTPHQPHLIPARHSADQQDLFLHSRHLEFRGRLPSRQWWYCFADP